MQRSKIGARVLDGNRIQCQIVSPSGTQLLLSGNTTGEEPDLEKGGLGSNRSLVSTAWAFALANFEAVSLPDLELHKYAEKRAAVHQKMAEWLADVGDELTLEKAHGWCSRCFGQHDHWKSSRPEGHLPAYVCDGCGSPTLACLGPGCKNMAMRNQGAFRAPRYYAEHRHEIPGFVKAEHKMVPLENYAEFLKYDKVNLNRATRFAGFGLAGVGFGGPSAMATAPAIGGAVGALLGGYSGAAATSFGLAWLGGGAVAAGGLGMAGGTVVVTALGAAVGGSLGASVTNAYVRQCSSLHIELLRGGSGVPVNVCNGFLTENGKGWGEWNDIVSKRYPGASVCRVHWGQGVPTPWVSRCRSGD